MSNEPKIKYKDFYQRMFAALERGDRAEADKYRVLMEKLRQAHVNSRTFTPDLDEIPEFVKLTLNKSQEDLGIAETSNCINAALNFHLQKPTFVPFTTMEFLRILRSQYSQLELKNHLAEGDLIVFWSRSNDVWKHRKILVENLDPASPGFPFGLVFDHVAVYLGNDALYHKPDPTMSSRYQINHWDDVVGFSEVVRGFELTYHQRIR